MVGFSARLQIDIWGLLSCFSAFCISCNQCEAVLSHFQFSVQRSGNCENDITPARRKCSSVAKGDQNISWRWCQMEPLQSMLKFIARPLSI